MKVVIYGVTGVIGRAAATGFRAATGSCGVVTIGRTSYCTGRTGTLAALRAWRVASARLFIQLSRRSAISERSFKLPGRRTFGSDFVRKLMGFLYVSGVECGAKQGGV